MLKIVNFVSIALLFAYLTAQEAPAQGSPLPPSQSSPRLKSLEERKVQWLADHHLILNVAVKDASGRAVSHLASRNFVLLDNARSTAIRSFREMSGHQQLEPLHTVLVFDRLNCSIRELSDQRQAVAAFLVRNQGHLGYPTSLAVVSDAGMSVGELSEDGNDLLKQLKQLPLTSQMDEKPAVSATFGRSNAPNLAINPPGTGAGSERERRLLNLNRRFSGSVPALLHLATAQEDAPGRCLIIWLGRGWPLLAESDFIADSSRARVSYFQSIVTLTKLLLDAQITIYNVSARSSASGHEGEYRTFLSAVSSPEDAKAGNLSLQVFALHSGGAVIDQSNDLTAGILFSLQDVESYYSIAFDALPASTSDEFHSLEVKILDRPALTVTNYNGYYDQP
jgi:VWFA-related protein